MNWLSRIAVLCLVLCGCGPKQPAKQIHGQIFLTLKNRETIKLSLVPVFLVESNHARLQQSSAIQNYTNDLFRGSRQLNGILNQVQKLRLEMDDIESANEALASSNRVHENSLLDIKINGRKFRGAQIAAARAEFSRLQSLVETNQSLMDSNRKALVQMESRRTALNAQFDSLTNGVMSINPLAHFMRVDWRPLAKTLTDADGFFTLTHTSNVPVVLVAFTRRERPDGPEDCFWIVPPETNKMLLHNGNLLMLPR